MEPSTRTALNTKHFAVRWECTAGHYKGAPGRSFLDGPATSEATWQNKYKQLRNFFLFWLARNAISAVPLPLREATCRFSILGRASMLAEIRRLLSMIRVGQRTPNCKIDIRTLRVLILFLYGTGALLSDALTFRRDDLDLRKRTITFRSSRPYRSRTIPIARTYNVLRRYHAADHRTNIARIRTCSSTRTGLYRVRCGGDISAPPGNSRALRAATAQPAVLVYMTSDIHLQFTG